MVLVDYNNPASSNVSGQRGLVISALYEGYSSIIRFSFLCLKRKCVSEDVASLACSWMLIMWSCCCFVCFSWFSVCSVCWRVLRSRLWASVSVFERWSLSLRLGRLRVSGRIHRRSLRSQWVSAQQTLTSSHRQRLFNSLILSSPACPAGRYGRDCARVAVCGKGARNDPITGRCVAGDRERGEPAFRLLFHVSQGFSDGCVCL